MSDRVQAIGWERSIRDARETERRCCSYGETRKGFEQGIDMSTLEIQSGLRCAGCAEWGWEAGQAGGC